jgi:tetratricopeptide (TPR) repeat protein
MAASKVYSQESLQRRRILGAALVVLFLLTIPLQRAIDPTARELKKGEVGLTQLSGGLTNEFMLLPLLGFREAAAGLLWVRCDEFFHSGDYDAILPLVRLITWLDPHADNVYVTGAWHLSYNFTDSSERSDRRYIPPSQKLLDEGIANNPNLWEIKFEKGWQNYDKIKDFPAAEAAFEMAMATPPRKDSEDYPWGAPLRVVHTWAHSFEKQGRIPEALAAWKEAMKRSEYFLKKNPKDYSTKQLYAAEKHNYEITLQRYYDRYTDHNHSDVNQTAKLYGKSYPAVLQPVPGDPTPQPWNTSFEPVVKITRAKVFEISGRFNSADGARIDVRIADEDYKPQDISGVLNSFDVPPDQTILMDTISVRKTKFKREMDMSRDVKMYSFSKPYLKIVLSYNPRSTSPHLQDRFGWNGEGLTDDNPNRVWVDKREKMRGTKMIEGQGGEGPVWDGKDESWKVHGQPPRLIKVTYRVATADVLSGAEKTLTDKDIVPNED